MASLNVAEWSPDQVADWLSGLGPTVARYVPALRERGLDGAKLLTLRCDDLEYLGMHIIGHQELLLEAVEHLRNFQYEVSRECVQQLALRVSVVATSLARALRHHTDARLETQTLADVARTVHAVKPLVCWLDRWPLCSSGSAAASLAERKAALLKLSLEAATCAQRDRFAEQPARAVAAAAATTAATADYIIQEVSDPMILQPASLDTVTLRQCGKPLGFDVVPSFCGHHQLADIRFGSPAHASGAVHIGDEIVQVGGQCVIGWSGAAVVRACSAASGAELSLKLRRRGARAPPALATPQLRARTAHHYRPRHLFGDLRLDSMMYMSPLPFSPGGRAAPLEESAAEDAPPPDEPPSSSDESEPLSPPASPTRLDHTRMYPPKPRTAVQRRHTISGGSSLYKRPSHTIEQFWQELKQQRGSAGVSPAPGAPRDDVALYARDKAVSCSTGLELTPRPRTCLGVVPDRPHRHKPPTETRLDDDTSAGDRNRGKLDKSHSTPAYDFDTSVDEPGPLAAQTIPESPTTPTDSPLAPLLSTDKADRILDFKKSSSQIGEAILHQRGRRVVDEKPPEVTAEPPGVAPRDDSSAQRVLETINIAMLEHRRRSAVERAPPDPPVHRDLEPRSATPRLVARRVAAGVAPRAPSFPVLRAVSRPEPAPSPPSPLRLTRPIDVAQVSAPLRHLSKQEMRAVVEAGGADGAPPPPAPRRRDPPAPPAASAPASPCTGEIVVGAQAAGEAPRSLALSPTSAVRGIFPTSKSRSLKKKSSILAKRRMVPARALAARGAAGGVWQRVRARAAAQPRWARRHLLLTHNLLYAYRTPECSKADCMIYLEGFTVSAAGEVKSRAHAFKVYHTGTAFYFACDTREHMLAWIQLIHRATLLPSLTAHQMDLSKQFSETDYSENESDAESPHRERDRERDRDKDKDKSKFGSLKKLTGRMQRSESHENVPHSSTSLDRKYLRFFSRNKTKDDTKINKSAGKGVGVPVPTEHYRSYRRVAPPGGAGAEAEARRRPPKPINYIHASNPNLLEFDNSDFVTKPTLHAPKQKPKAENLMGFVTLEQFMLKKQAEERRQVYSNRVLMGVEHSQRQELQRRLHDIVPDVIYGEMCAGEQQAGAGAGGAGGTRSPRLARDNKPVSVKGKDGYEKIVYPDEVASTGSEEGAPEEGAGTARRRTPPPPPPPAHERWRDSLRRNDKVHLAPGAGAGAREAPPPAPRAPHLAPDSWSGAGGAGAPAGGEGGGVSRLRLMFGGGRAHRDSARQQGGACGTWAGAARARRVPAAQYPHLQCPPTFQPETYSLARPPHADADT